MGTQLRLCTRRCCQGTDGGQLAVLPVEVVALEDVAEQMGLQELTGAKSNKGTFDGAAGNACLIGYSCLTQRLACGDRPAGVVSGCVLNTALFACLDRVHQFVQRIEAARKPGIGVELNQNLLGLADG